MSNKKHKKPQTQPVQPIKSTHSNKNDVYDDASVQGQNQDNVQDQSKDTAQVSSTKNSATAKDQQSYKELKSFAEFLIKDSTRLLKKYPDRISSHVMMEIRQAKDDLQAMLDEKRLTDELVEHLNQLLAFHFASERKSLLRDNVESIAVALLLALVIRAFLFEAFVIPSGSMIPTLAVNDFIFVNKFVYGIVNPFSEQQMLSFSMPKRGDIVIFSYPCQPELDYIKRAIALPGDTVEVDPHGFVYVNGKLNDEKLIGEFKDFKDFQATDLENNTCSQLGLKPFVYEMKADIHKVDQAHANDYQSSDHYKTIHCTDQLPTAQRSTTNPHIWDQPNKQICEENAFGFQKLPAFPWVVPEGHMFVMGDNREGSSDSRYWGFVPFTHLKGRAGMIWLSYNFTTPAPYFIRFDRMFNIIHQRP